jgi:Bacterial SCP ortholog
MSRDPEVMNKVKSTLSLLESKAPGRAIEVRIPPYAAIQCGEGPTHTRGTPPNVIEMKADTWLALANGETTWAAEITTGSIYASGARADLSMYLPLTENN